MEPDRYSTSILLIEDDHDTRVSLRSILEAEGYKVFSAANGKSAIELLGRIDPPTLILLDFMMPLMNGEEVLITIRSNPALCSIPVIVVSAFSVQARRLNANAFLEKPIDLKILLRTLRENIPGRLGGGARTE